MIKFENVEVVGWEATIRGMRNPMNSWEKSDSYDSVNCGKCGIVDREGVCRPAEHRSECEKYKEFYVGPNDMSLMKRLREAGTDHRKFMRMLTVYVDITAPLYWWKEFDTYKVGTVANSCSTMHKIHEKEFTLDDFSHEHLINIGMLADSYGVLKHTINMLNFWRERLNQSEEERERYFNYNGYPYVPSKKDCWHQMIQLLPSSYNQKRTVMMNYEVLANIYKSRKNHKLDEWSWHEGIIDGDKTNKSYIGFCDWIETLPYHELITGEFK